MRNATSVAVLWLVGLPLWLSTGEVATGQPILERLEQKIRKSVAQSTEDAARSRPPVARQPAEVIPAPPGKILEAPAKGPASIEELLRRIEQLERRVADLERALSLSRAKP